MGLSVNKGKHRPRRREDVQDRVNLNKDERGGVERGVAPGVEGERSAAKLEMLEPLTQAIVDGMSESKSNDKSQTEDVINDTVEPSSQASQANVPLSDEVRQAIDDDVMNSFQSSSVGGFDTMTNAQIDKLRESMGMKAVEMPSELKDILKGQPISEKLFRLVADTDVIESDGLRDADDISEVLGIGGYKKDMRTSFDDVKYSEYLSTPEKWALYKYSDGTFDGKVNSFLRKLSNSVSDAAKAPGDVLKLEKIKTILSDETVRAQATLMMTGLGKLIYHKKKEKGKQVPLIITRGTAAMGQEVKQGDVFYDAGMLSTANKPSRDGWYNKRYQLVLASKQGIDISAGSGFDSEAEILIFPGTTFHGDFVLKHNDKVNIAAREIDKDEKMDETTKLDASGLRIDDQLEMGYLAKKFAKTATKDYKAVSPWYYDSERSNPDKVNDAKGGDIVEKIMANNDDLVPEILGKDEKMLASLKKLKAHIDTQIHSSVGHVYKKFLNLLKEVPKDRNEAVRMVDAAILKKDAAREYNRNNDLFNDYLQRRKAFVELMVNEKGAPFKEAQQKWKEGEQYIVDNGVISNSALEYLLDEKHGGRWTELEATLARNPLTLSDYKGAAYDKRAMQLESYISQSGLGSAYFGGHAGELDKNALGIFLQFGLINNPSNAMLDSIKTPNSKFEFAMNNLAGKLKDMNDKTKLAKWASHYYKKINPEAEIPDGLKALIDDWDDGHGFGGK